MVRAVRDDRHFASTQIRVLDFFFVNLSYSDFCAHCIQILDQEMKVFQLTVLINLSSKLSLFYSMIRYFSSPLISPLP